LHINPCTKLNKANYKIQDYFANRQIKEDVKCNNLLDGVEHISRHKSWNTSQL
jgi:hypothetical protein